MYTDKYRGCIAIDLGTTNCVVSSITPTGEYQVIPNLDGEILTPSFIWLKKDDKTQSVDYKVGKTAKEQMSIDPENVVCSYKTYMGEKDHYIKTMFGRKFTAEHCSSLVLKYLKDSAEKFTGDVVNKAVITVPAYFSDLQKESTKRAAIKAGLEVIRLIAEPTAAAYYYGVTGEDKEKIVLAFDIGGGTFDVSVISLNGDTSMVMGVGGDKHLGGDNIDYAIAQSIAKKYGIDIEEMENDDRERLIRIAEKGKIEISENIGNGSNSGYKVKATEVDDRIKDFTLSQKLFREIIEPFMKRAMESMIDTINKASLTKEDIQEVLLIGGTSRLPMIREMISEFFENEKFNEEYFKNYIIDPDLSVCYGARVVMKNILDNEEANIADVVPIPIGIEMSDGSMKILISRNKLLPASARESLTNSEDGQTEVRLEIFEGFDKIARNNTHLGTLILPCKPVMKKTLQIHVKLKISKDGLIDVTCIVDATREKISLKRHFDFDTQNVEELMDSLLEPEEIIRLAEENHKKTNIEAIKFDM